MCFFFLIYVGFDLFVLLFGFLGWEGGGGEGQGRGPE